MLSERIEPSDLAPARHHDRGTWNGSVVDFAPQHVRHALQRWGKKPDRFRFGERQRRGLRDGDPPGGGWRGHFLFLCSFWLAGLARAKPSVAEKTSLDEKIWLEQASTASPLPLAGCLCLKRRGSAATQWSHRSVAQLVEHRSPKPGVGSSSLSTPASDIKDLGRFFPGLPNRKTAKRVQFRVHWHVWRSSHRWRATMRMLPTRALPSAPMQDQSYQSLRLRGSSLPRAITR